MQGAQIATLLVVATLGFARPLMAGSSDAAEEARRRLSRNEATAAIAILEGELPSAGSGRDPILGMLRHAYEMAASQAEAAGQARKAAAYREDLKILNRKARPTAPPTAESVPQSAPAPAPLPEAAAPPAAIEPKSTPSVEPIPLSDPVPILEPESLKPVPAPAEPEPRHPESVADPLPVADLSAGDFAFQAKKYAEAGRVYAGLAREKRLPAERTEHWAYCRSTAVVERINARPSTDAEWAEIDAEIDQIRAMNPNNWLGEYLRNRASERLAGRKKSNPGSTVVRASSPEEPAPLDRPVRPASIPAPARPNPVDPGTNPATSRAIPAVKRWQTRETANFRIYHSDPALANRVAQAAESARKEQAQHWTSNLASPKWQPTCEIYLYPNAKQYAQMTGQPEDSPGFSTMGMNAGKIISRRISLRADHPTLVQAVLPHEITHVILADIFPTEQIPRWADEGLAVLAEPLDEQQRRAADLNQPLAANQLFKIEDLMGMDYPDHRYWALYYAQSVSLTRFLVEQGTPAQMIQFLQGSQKNGIEAELRNVYKIDGFGDLQAKWLVYARNQPPTRTASTPESTEVTPDLKVR